MFISSIVFERRDGNRYALPKLNFNDILLEAFTGEKKIKKNRLAFKSFVE